MEGDLCTFSIVFFPPLAIEKENTWEISTIVAKKVNVRYSLNLLH